MQTLNANLPIYLVTFLSFFLNGSIYKLTDSMEAQINYMFAFLLARDGEDFGRRAISMRTKSKRICLQSDCVESLTSPPK